MSSEFDRITWLKCPNCAYRFYAGVPLMLAKDTPAICPKCRSEFDPRLNVEPKISQVRAADIL